MRIAIIGAGIGGLTLAAALRYFDPQLEIDLYERDATNRAQGYSLGLKGDAGILALRRLGLFEQLRPFMTPITNFVFCNQRGHPLLELPSGGDDRRLTMRVKRAQLKVALRAAASDAPIHFGAECIGYRQTSDSIEVQFRDGQTVRADYAVAADGVGSAVRQRFVGGAKRYLGLTAMVGDAPIALTHPLLEGGYFMTLGDDGSSAFCYREADGIHLSYTQHAASEDALSRETPEALLWRVQEVTAAWHDPIPRITAAIDPATVVSRSYYDKEPIKRVRDGRMWLIGDAAHPMCRFQGQGANMAMLDALKLGHLLAAGSGSADREHREATKLEDDIVARGRKATLESRNAANQFHTTSRFKQRNRNIGFSVANFFIKRFSRPTKAQ
jgi:salicylate hydroxylase